MPIAVAAAIVAPAAQPHSGHQAMCPSIGSFRSFSAKVWALDRRSGSPAPKTLAAERAQLKRSAGCGTRGLLRAIWRRDKRRYYRHVAYCRSGPTFSGRVSTFTGGRTADGVHVATEPGIALRSTATLGDRFYLRTAHGSDVVTQTDWGPASWTGRAIDITEAEAARVGGVVTDSYGSATLIPPGC